MAIAVHGWLRRYIKVIHARLGELVHLSAIYLGIAVLVTLAAAAVVPSTRAQVQQIYQVVVETLRPEALSRGPYAGLGWLEADQETGLQLAHTQLQLNSTGYQEIRSAYTGFAQVLERAAAGPNIKGLSRKQLQALRSYIARKYSLSGLVTDALILLAYDYGREKSLDPLLILAVIAIESSYNPFVESHVGAQGLMQVMTRVHQDKLEHYTEEDLAVFSPVANMRAGTQILYDCRKRRGSITGALACYVGATGPSDGGYGAKVLAERRRIALAAGLAIQDD